VLVTEVNGDDLDVDGAIVGVVTVKTTTVITFISMQ